MPVKDDGVEIPSGFLFSTVEAAVKKPGRKDMALICSEKESVMAGMFTTNKVKAAPVKLDARQVKSGKGQAIIVNSGNANACTGAQGMKDAAAMCSMVAEARGIKADRVYACSTGVIGAPMPMDRIRAKIPELVSNLGEGSFYDVATAIMTTDTFPKIVSRQVAVGGKVVTIAGICKGAGMIMPNMATMLAFIITDAKIEKAALDSALKRAVRRSFNRVTIDGDTSTNDTALIMANAAAGNSVIRPRTRDFEAFASALTGLTYKLSEMIARDGEGSTKLVEVEIRNAKSEKEAEKGAFAIANSLLVKTAIYGNDANWGRLLCALGYSGITMAEEKTDVYLNDVLVARKGVATGVDKEANEAMKSDTLNIVIDMGIGKAGAKVLTCDLTTEYIKINAEYRT
jgi:glutamate N-acetyltransferase/amino-acid N-acetyltransferase